MRDDPRWHSHSPEPAAGGKNTAEAQGRKERGREGERKTSWKPTQHTCAVFLAASSLFARSIDLCSRPVGARAFDMM